MYLFCTFSPLLVCFAYFSFVAVDFFSFLLAYLCVYVFVCVCVCVRACVCVLLSLSFFSPFVYFMCSFHFIAGGVRFNLPLVGN